MLAGGVFVVTVVAAAVEFAVFAKLGMGGEYGNCCSNWRSSCGGSCC